MTTKKNKRFDAVAESRKWRIKTGAVLTTMTRSDRLAYLQKLGERVRAKLRAKRPLTTASS